MSDSKARPVLLDKTVRAALEFVSRDETRQVLTGVHITPDYVEATDSYRLCRITHAEGISALDYPHEPVTGAPAFSDVPAEGIVVPARAIKRALANMPRKSTLPILNRIAVKVDGHMVRLGTNDLDCVSAHTAGIIEGTFPDIDGLLEKYRAMDTGDTVAFNTALLASVAKAFGMFLGGDHTPVQMRCFGTMQPAIFEATNSSQQTMTALLMPVRAG